MNLRCSDGLRSFLTKLLKHLLILYFSTGQIFSYPVKLTWEFTSDDPVRSVFPLWPVYGLPMLLLRWLWIGNGHDGDIPPIAVFWTLRVLMFALSFVLEDWALHELVQSPRHRRVAVLLVASSYVTWTYQTHTFSNSIETLAVAWSLVLIQRIVENKVGALNLARRKQTDTIHRRDLLSSHQQSLHLWSFLAYSIGLLSLRSYLSLGFV